MTELSREAQHLALDEELAEPTPPPQIISEEQAAQEAEPPRPEYLNPRYQSVEEQARAYNESERAMHEANQRAAQLEQRLAALEEAQQAEPEYDWGQQPGYNPMQQAITAGDYETQLRALAEEDPILAMRAIAAEQAQQMQAAQLQQMQQASQAQQQQAAQNQQAQLTQQNTQAQLIADAAYERAVARHPDYEEYHTDVVNMINDPEWINPDDTWDLAKLERAVERAYTVKKAERITATDEQLLAQGLSPADIERQRKLNAQTLQGRSGGPDPELTPDEQALAGILNSGTDGSYKSARRTLWGDMRQPQ